MPHAGRCGRVWAFGARLAEDMAAPAVAVVVGADGGRQLWTPAVVTGVHGPVRLVPSIGVSWTPAQTRAYITRTYGKRGPRRKRTATLSAWSRTERGGDLGRQPAQAATRAGRPSRIS